MPSTDVKHDGTCSASSRSRRKPGRRKHHHAVREAARAGSRWQKPSLSQSRRRQQRGDRDRTASGTAPEGRKAVTLLTLSGMDTGTPELVTKHAAIPCTRRAAGHEEADTPETAPG